MSQFVEALHKFACESFGYVGENRRARFNNAKPMSAPRRPRGPDNITIISGNNAKLTNARSKPRARGNTITILSEVIRAAAIRDTNRVES